MGRLGVGWGPAGPAGWAPCSQGVLPMGRIPELRACPGLLEARHTAADGGWWCPAIRSRSRVAGRPRPRSGFCC